VATNWNSLKRGAGRISTQTQTVSSSTQQNVFDDLLNRCTYSHRPRIRKPLSAKETTINREDQMLGRAGAINGLVERMTEIRRNQNCRSEAHERTKQGATKNAGER